MRAVVHCAGRGGKLRLVEKDGTPGNLDLYQEVVDINLVGSFNVLRLAAARMVKSEEVGGERGVVIMTASVAASKARSARCPTPQPRQASWA